MKKTCYYKQSQCYYNEDIAHWSENFLKGIKLPTHRKTPPITNTPVEQAVEPVVEPVPEPVPEPIAEPVPEPIPEPVPEPTTQQYIYNDLKNNQAIFDRYKEVWGEYPEEITHLHFTERMNVSSKYLHNFSINMLAVHLRTILFNIHSFNATLASKLRVEPIVISDAAIRKMFATSVNHNDEIVKYISNDDGWSAVCKMLKEFVIDNKLLGAKTEFRLRELAEVDYEYAVKHINEPNCGLKYGRIHKHLRSVRLDQKSLTEASANHRVGSAEKLANELKNMDIVKFYEKWKELTNKQKERLSSVYNVTRREPKTIGEIESLYKSKLISRATYFNLKKELIK